MEKLLTADDVAGILRVGKRTAYSYMTKMHHLERPLRVTEDSLRNWINEKAVCPETGRKMKAKRPLLNDWKIERM